MHERTVFTRKRPNACPEELPVNLTIKLKHYISDNRPVEGSKKKGYRVDDREFSATSQRALDEVVSAIFKIKVNHQMYAPGLTQGMDIRISGTIGEKVIDLHAKNILTLQKQVNELEFTVPAYNNWALKLRKL